MGDNSYPSENIELHDHQRVFRDDKASSNVSDFRDPTGGADSPPENAVSALPKWNQDRSNVFKTLSTFLAFIILGANDAAYGVSLPSHSG